MLTQNLKFGKSVKITCRYYPFTHLHHKSISYDVWFLRYKVQKTKFVVIMGHFLLFRAPNNRKNQNFEKMEKISGDIIILHLCTTNGDHMMYGSWDMKHDRHNFLSFWAIFALLPPPLPPNNPENQTFEKIKKKLLEMLSSYTWVP